MARRTTDILFGVEDQVILHRCLAGRPAAATFAVFADTTGDDGAAEFDGAATIDDVETTVTAASGRSQPDPHTIHLADTAGIVTGRKYLLERAGLREWVEPIHIEATSIRVRHALANDYAIGATFVSTYVLVPVDDAWAADRSHLSDAADPNPDYRVRLAVTVAGATVLAYEFFDLVRGVAGYDVDIHDLDVRFPGLADSLPTEHRADQGRALMEAAWRTVRADFAAIGLNDSAIRDHEAVDELVILAAIKLIAEGGYHPSQFGALEFTELVTRNYERWWEKHFKVAARHPISRGTDGAATSMTVDDFWSK